MDLVSGAREGQEWVVLLRRYMDAFSPHTCSHLKHKPRGVTMGMLFRDQPQCLQVREWKPGSLRDLNPHIGNWAKHAMSRAFTRALLNLLSQKIVLSALF